MKTIYKNKKIKFLIAGLALVLVASLGIFVQSCSQEDDVINSIDVKLSKSEYEAILKTEVDSLIAKAGPMGENFLTQQGLPIWESKQWVATNSQDMLVIPLLGIGENKKCIIGVITKNTITPVIMEISAIDKSQSKIYSLTNQLLYDSNKGLFVSIPRLKSDNECDAAQQAAENLLQNGGDASSLYNAYYGSNATYNSNENAGDLSINVTDDASSSSSSLYVGHAWISYTDKCGNTTTFGTWGNQGTKEYFVNKEKDKGMKAKKSYKKPITYSQFQSVLKYNSTPGNTNWSLTSNCASYASGVWNAATGQKVNASTPMGVESWINANTP